MNLGNLNSKNSANSVGAEVKCLIFDVTTELKVIITQTKLRMRVQIESATGGVLWKKVFLQISQNS